MSKFLQIAIDQFKPVQVLLLFSGGHDSLCSTHYAAEYLKSKGIPFKVYHGNTGIGIRETREYVYSTCKHFGWELAEGHPKAGERYEDIVRQHGFPGPTRLAHQMMYRLLKERALRHYVTYECKSSVYARENVLLVTGIRKDESRIRMGYSETCHKEDSRVWVTPIFYWTKEQCEKYMQDNTLPRNPVKDKICISGECLCGAFAGREELAEIKKHYPEAYAEIERLHKIAIDNGYPWDWASGPVEWYKNHPMGTLDMFMCSGCEVKKEFIEPTNTEAKQ